MMGPDVKIIAFNHEYSNLEKPMCLQGFQPMEPVIIEDDVWIGTRETILPGVKIGKGSILGAGCVVTKDVKPYSIMGGNPARLIRSRREI